MTDAEIRDDEQVAIEPVEPLIVTPAAEYARAGEQVGSELVRKLIRVLNLVPLQPKPYKCTTIPGEPEQAVADLVGRDFSADRPGSSWSGTSPTSRPGRAGCIYKFRGIIRRVGRRDQV